MKDLRQNTAETSSGPAGPASGRSADNGESGDSGDPWSERLVLFVVAWIVVVVLLPLHVLLALNLFFTSAPFALIIFLAIFAVPLLLADIWAYRWFSDNFSVFRWINRSKRTTGKHGARR